MGGEDIGCLPPKLLEHLKHIEEQFTVTGKKLKEITRQFETELRDGLENHGSNISMHVTWVHGLPTGHESGQFVTLDIGGTNLRVCSVTLDGDGTHSNIQQSYYRLPGELKTGDRETFWDFVGDCLETFVKDHQLQSRGDDDPLPLGFCFSYPADQDAIDHGRLKTWTKGFEIKGVEGEDVAAQLREAMEKRNLPLKLVALVNDTTGAMVASAYNDPETIIGAIFGTGCNAAYVETVGAIPKLRPAAADLPPDTPMAINCEYGAFDNAHRVLPRTEYDRAVDARSPKPSEQAFEKMSAGLYLGEIFRLVLLGLHDNNDEGGDGGEGGGYSLFEGQDVSRLREPYVLDTGFLSAIENEAPEAVRARFVDAVGVEPSGDEMVLARRLAQIVAVRSARLCTCGVAAICRMKGIGTGHVAADGSVANKHPKFKARWAQALGEVLDWPGDRGEDPIVITSAEDGSGIGAAVIAAMTLQRRSKEARCWTG